MAAVASLLVAMAMAATASAADDRARMVEMVKADEELARVEMEMDRRGIRIDFGAWMDRAGVEDPSYRWDYPFMRLIQGEFDRITGGDTLRLMLQVAGRHSKTSHVKGYSAYRLERDGPEILFATYNQDQANEVSLAVKDVVKRRGGEVRRDAAKRWDMANGGGFRAVGGPRSGVASVNADLIIIDDPLGSRAQAESQAERDEVWDWITTDILARCRPDTPVVFSMPRWHQDDPAGRILDRQEGLWRIVDMPGRAIEDEEDLLGRAPDELLWPEERGEQWHDWSRELFGTYGYASFILCRPRPREGSMFKWEWWGIIEEVPAVGMMVRYWDTAGTDPVDGSDPDYTAGALLCRMPSGQTAIVDVARFRHSLAPRNAKMLEVCQQDLQKYPGRIRWCIETETGIDGKRRMVELVRMLQNTGMAVTTDPTNRTKKTEIRWEPLASKAEAGNVVLVRGPWNDAFRHESIENPGGRHDDQIDAAAGADAKLASLNTASVLTLRQ